LRAFSASFGLLDGLQWVFLSIHQVRKKQVKASFWGEENIPDWQNAEQEGIEKFPGEPSNKREEVMRQRIFR